MKKKKLFLVCILTLSIAVLMVSIGCAPQANSDTSDEAKTDTEEISTADFTWTTDSDCSLCHEKQAASQTDSTCLLSLHAGSTCSTCHTDSASLETAHAKATAQGSSRAGLKTTSVPETTCLTCHNKDEISSKTSQSTALTDVNGTVVNPHDLPATADHEELDCNSCHQIHAADADLEKKASRACASCHHADVYECYTCHS